MSHTPHSAKSTLPWFDIARAEMGVTQGAPGASNPRIEAYHATVNNKGWDDQVSWCGSFVNWCFLQMGMPGTNSALARSWLEWGYPLTEPRFGCVTVLTREDPNGWRGHVGFYLREEAGQIWLLGGNQLGQVREHSYDASSLLGYRWPGEASGD